MKKVTCQNINAGMLGQNFNETIEFKVGHEMDTRISMQRTINKGNFMVNGRNKEISDGCLINYGNDTH